MITIHPKSRILFQGDSITNAFRKPEEVCNAYQLGAGYAMIASAWLLATRPADGLEFFNRGVSGEGIRGLQARWQADCLDLRPDILSILVGVNDADQTGAGRGLSLMVYETEYRLLLEHTRKALPNTRFVLCEPFLMQVGVVAASGVADVRERAEIVRTLAADFGAVLVPLQDVFRDALRLAPADYWMFDGIHPTAQGHWLIAEAWLRAVAGQSTSDFGY